MSQPETPSYIVHECAGCQYSPTIPIMSTTDQLCDRLIEAIWLATVTFS
jgi:hypothetical protein